MFWELEGAAAVGDGEWLGGLDGFLGAGLEFGLEGGLGHVVDEVEWSGSDLDVGYGIVIAAAAAGAFN